MKGFCSPYLVVMMLALPVAIGCQTSDTETVSKCYPNDGDCEAILQSMAAADSPTDANTGQRSYQMRCSSCHGLDGKGAGHSDRGDFTSAPWQAKYSDAQIMTFIRNGRGMKMPGQHVPSNEMKALIGHVRSLSAQTTPAKSDTSPRSY